MRRGVMASSHYVASGGGGISYEWLGYTGSVDYAGTSATLSGVGLGTATTDRQIVVMFGARNMGTPTSVSIGGVAATRHVAQPTGGGKLYVYCAAVPTGATGDIVLNFSGIYYRFVMSIWAIYTPVTLLDSAVSSVDNTTLTVTGNAGDLVLAGAVSNNNAFTFTGITPRAVSAIVDASSLRVADQLLDASGDFSVTFDNAAGSAFGRILAVYQPAA